MSGKQGQRGRCGEQRAETWLTARGLKLLTRNYSCRGGEIDLIMLDDSGEYGPVLVFVEVRSRAPDARVGGLESVDGHKRRRLVHAARHFLAKCPDYHEHLCRFDVIAVGNDDESPEWIADAFDIDSQ